MIAPTNNPISQGKHGTYNAVDYKYLPDSTIYAPEDGKVTFYQLSGDCGNNLQITSGGNVHGFCHLESASVKVGDTVKKGQAIGIMGYTGLTDPVGPAGRHLHWVVRQGNTYIYPPTLVNESGGSMSADITIRQTYLMGLRREPDPGGYATFRQTSDAVLVSSIYTSGERGQVEANLNNVQATANLVPGLQADISAKDTTITQQTDQIGVLAAQNGDKEKLIAAQQKRIAELEASTGTPADPDSVVITKDGFWEWFNNFINFFKKGK